MGNPHPHLGVIRDRLVKMYKTLATELCTKQLPGFAYTTHTKQEEGNITADYHNLVLTSDAKSGIVPVWFIVYQYNQVTPEYRAEAKATLLGPKALQAINPKPMPEVVRELIEFEKQHKHARYVDMHDRQSSRVGTSILTIRATLLALEKYCVGQVYAINPDTELPDDRIVMVDLFLKDTADVDQEGVYQSKIKLVIAAPDFIEASLHS